jgi:hypothetical protein
MKKSLNSDGKNTTNINKANNHLLPQLTEGKKDHEL